MSLASFRGSFGQSKNNIWFNGPAKLNKQSNLCALRWAQLENIVSSGYEKV